MIATCDPTEIAYLEGELAKAPGNMGVGVVDCATGLVRIFTYDDTDAFSRANAHLQVMAGHEAAAAMAGFAPAQARGFVLAKQVTTWHVFNRSHWNRVDAQANTMCMNPATFHAIVSALQTAGVSNPVIH